MNLLIIGAGGHGRCCYEIAKRMKCFEAVDFVDDHAKHVLDKKVIDCQYDRREQRLIRYLRQIFLEEKPRPPIGKNEGQTTDLRPIPLVEKSGDLI